MIKHEEREPVQHSVVIGNDVWVGENVIIFNNVVIGDGAVIGAGSIITKDVPPYAIVIGVNQIVKYRFNREQIDALLKMKCIQILFCIQIIF